MSKLLPFIKRVQRLAWIDRCSNTPHIHPYSVARHSFYTALYAMLFASLENERIWNHNKENPDDELKYYDLSEVIKKALVHDLEESITGDILFPLHEEHFRFKESLEETRKECVRKQVFCELPPFVMNQCISLWENAKNYITKEGRLVAAMDKFEILVFAIHELDMGNEAFREIYNNAMAILIKNYDIPSITKVIEEIVMEYAIIRKEGLK